MNKEERKNKSVKEIIDGKMDAYGMTRRSVYSILGILGCLTLTLVWSIVGTNFDPAVFLTWNYWISLIIQFAIAIFSMITGRQIGDDMSRNRPDGQFRRELAGYERERTKIDSIGMFEYFETWLEIYRAKKVMNKTKETLREFGIKQDEVLDLDLHDIPQLRKPFKKSWVGTPFEGKYENDETIFMSLDDEQIEAIMQIRKGAVKVPYVSSSYFMNALKETSVDEWNRAAKADKKKGLRLASGYSYRIAIMLAVSVALNGIVPAPYENAVAATVAMNVVQRVFTLISSSLWGYYLGTKVVDMDIVFLAYKSLILKTYTSECESKTFVPETIKEKAEREYNEYKEAERQAAESVITPETVGENGFVLLEGRK